MEEGGKLSTQAGQQNLLRERNDPVREKEERMLREEGKPLAGPPDLKNRHDCYLSPGF